MYLGNDEDAVKVTKKLTCTYAKKYLALREPRCGCQSCEDKWAQKKQTS